MSGAEFRPSPMQEGMVLESIRESRAGVGIEQLVVDLDETVLAPDLQSALDRIVSRHDALRMEFRFEGTQTSLRFAEAFEVPLAEEDWSKLSADEQSRRFDAFLRQDREAGFDLAKAPLLRTTCLQLGGTRSRVVLTFHHAILDGRSHPIVLGELFQLIDAKRNGEDVELPPAPSFRDFLRWRGEQAQGASHQYWRDLLADSRPGPVPDLPGGGAGPHEAAQEELDHRIGPGMTERISRLAAEHGVTLSTVLQAGWVLLLDRYCEDSDIVFGATRAGRHDSVPLAERTAGVFINTLPMRVDLSALESVDELLRVLRDQHLAHRPHEQTSLREIQALAPSDSKAPLLGTLVMVEDRSLHDELIKRDARWEDRGVRLIDKTSFPLALVVRAGDQLELQLEYDASRYDGTSIRRMMDHYVRLLQALCEVHEGAGDGGTLGQIEMMSKAEVTSLLDAVRPRSSAPREAELVVNAIYARCDAAPDAIAVEFGRRKVTYGELAQRSRFLAAHLSSLGVRPGKTIGLCLERSDDLIVGMLAALDAGASYVPLDPELPERRARDIAEDAGIEWVLAQRRTEASVLHLNLPVMSVDGSWSEHISASRPAAAPAQRHDIAYILYTSGTTGKPKGVMVSHAALANHAMAMQDVFRLCPSDRVLQFASFGFDVAIEEIIPTLISGATLILRTNEMISTASRFLADVDSAAISVLNLPTAYWHELVKANGSNPDRWPGCVRLLTVGGESASPAMLDQWRGQGTSHIRFLNAYGPTETTVTSTVFDLTADRWDGAEVPIGRPIANTMAMVFDECQRPVPQGVTGELSIGGAGVAAGYRGLPDLTAQSFRPNPYDDQGGRWYATGDRVRLLSDGCFAFVGRRDDQVKVRGFRIELAEVEEVLLRHPEIEAAAVVARRSKGGANDSLVAYYVPKKMGTLPVDALRDHVATNLPSYAVPLHWIPLEMLPISRTGKVDRKALASRRIQVESSPEESSTDQPRDALEELLAKLWEDLLEDSDFGIHDNFFDHGGHSLLAVQMMNDLEDELGVTCEIPDFFGNPTISALAQSIRAIQVAEGGGSLEESPEAVDVKASRVATVIPLRDDVDGLPLYCTLGYDQYVDLARDLGSRFPVYGVYHPFESLILENGEELVTDEEVPTVEEVARGYVRAIRAHRPEGPYCIGGLSFGGTVAFEVARQLRAAGQEVPVLALFDTILPRSEKRDWLGWLWARWAQLQAASRQEGLQKLGALRRKIHERLACAAKLEAASPVAPEEETPARQIRKRQKRMFHIMSHRYDRAGLHYDGKATLFRALRRDEGPRVRVDFGQGWQEIIHGGLDIRVCEGDHRGILQQPHVTGLAKVLAQYLEEAGPSQSPHVAPADDSAPAAQLNIRSGSDDEAK